MIKTYTSKIDNADFEYQIVDGNLSYKTSNWS